MTRGGGPGTGPLRSCFSQVENGGQEGRPGLGSARSSTSWRSRVSSWSCRSRVRSAQLMTQGALALALGVALTLNPRAVMRPNVFMLVLTLAAVVAVMSSIHSEFMVSSTYRSARYLTFLLVAWLLTPWWGRRDMLLLRCHRLCLAVVLGSVLLGAATSSGAALGGGSCPVSCGRCLPHRWRTMRRPCSARRSCCGCARCSPVDTRPSIVSVSGVLLVATHTRTALIGLFAGLVVGGASLFLVNARVRRTASTAPPGSGW